MIAVLLVSAALAGDSPFSPGATWATFDLAREWGSYQADGFKGQERGTLGGFDIGIVLPIPISDGIALDAYAGLDFGYGGGRASDPSGVDDVGAFRYHLFWGFGPAIADDGFRAWLRVGPYAGADTITGRITNGFSAHNGWTAWTGVRVGPVGGDVHVPVGARDRRFGARVVFTPFMEGHLGFALGYDRIHERSPIEDTITSKRLALSFGVL